MSTFESLLHEYGYYFVFGCAFLEGESGVVLAGIAAHRGYLHLGAVIVVAALGAALGDQLWFQLGRSRGKSFLQSKPHWDKGLKRFEALSERWGTPLILGFRFLYGMRMLGAAALGVSGVSQLRFTVLNFVGAFIWSVLTASIGFFFGKAVETTMGDMASYEQWIFVALLIIGLAATFRHWMANREVAD